MEKVTRPSVVFEPPTTATPMTTTTPSDAPSVAPPIHHRRRFGGTGASPTAPQFERTLGASTLDASTSAAFTAHDDATPRRRRGERHDDDDDDDEGTNGNMRAIASCVRRQRWAAAAAKDACVMDACGVKMMTTTRPSFVATGSRANRVVDGAVGAFERGKQTSAGGAGKPEDGDDDAAVGSRAGNAKGKAKKGEEEAGKSSSGSVDVDELRKKASASFATFGKAVRDGAEASGVDLGALDEAAKKAARRAASAAENAARAAGVDEKAKKSWLSPSGLASMAVNAVKEEYRLAMMDPGDAAAERRRAAGYTDAPPEPYDGTTAVAVAAEAKPSAFKKAWSGVKEKLGITSVFDKIEGLKRSTPYAKGAELAEDLRERWETSDSPMVHRIQDFQESMFTETEQGEAYRLIRQLDPMFNMNDFIAEVRRDIPKILGAYLKGDVEALQQTNLSSEMLERLSGQMNMWKHEGQMIDPRILDLSEVELMEVRLMENEPLVVLTFSCQQINCVRDKTGAIVEGGEDDIQSVHYLWAMQLTDKKFTTPDGREYSKPTWLLRELVLRGMMAVAA